MTEITQLKQRIAKLEQENAHLKRLQGISPFVIDVVDQIKEEFTFIDVSGNLIYCNQRFRDNFKMIHDVDLQMGVNLVDMLADNPTLQERTKQDHQRAIAGEFFIREVEHTINDMYYCFAIAHYPVWQNGEVIGFCTMGRDTTDKRITEKALRIEQHRIKTGLRGTNVTLFTQDTNLRYTWTYDPIQGYHAFGAGVVDEDWLERDVDVKLLTQLKRYVIETGKVVHEIITIQREGDLVTYEMALQPHLDENKNIIGLIGTAVDITNLQKMQQELMQAQLREKEIEQERELLAIREEFLAMVSHDFREPLAAIMTSQSLLQQYADRISPEKKLEHLQRIESQVQLMNEMVEDVLTHYRLKEHRQPFQPKWLNLIAFSYKHIQDFELRYNSGEYKFILEGDIHAPVQIYADETLLHRIFYNLLSNAVKYSPNGGTIHLQIHHSSQDVTVSVADEGIGIPAEDIQKLFKPFQRASNAGAIKGTGLGLPVVYRSVQLHGGEVECHSLEGKGTTFTIHLPIPD